MPAILILGPCRINAAFRPGSERRIYAAAERRSENGQAAKAKMRIAGEMPGEGPFSLPPVFFIT
jgi:hypothetical protein